MHLLTRSLAIPQLTRVHDIPLDFELLSVQHFKRTVMCLRGLTLCLMTPGVFLRLQDARVAVRLCTRHRSTIVPVEG